MNDTILTISKIISLEVQTQALEAKIIRLRETQTKVKQKGEKILTELKKSGITEEEYNRIRTYLLNCK